jgi:hypothetical protein
VNDLAGFWRNAEAHAIRAKAIAACRNETLLIYLATDDAENQRSVAVEKLSAYGRVVYGLTEEEVGHPKPGWGGEYTARVDELARKARVCKEGRCSAEVAAENLHLINIVEKERTEEARRLHHDMGLVV